MHRLTIDLRPLGAMWHPSTTTGGIAPWTRALFFALAAWFGLQGVARAQGAPGSNDPTFNVFDDGTYGDGANLIVRSIASQPDGKVLIGGEFTSYGGATRNRIARLEADGRLDASFNPGSGANSLVHALVLRPDGKLLVGGAFTSFDGATRNRIARLNADGSLDASFNPGTGASSTVLSLVLQPDGKLLVGGSFSSYGGAARNRIARLEADGSLDASFAPGAGANGTVNSIALQPDGKVLIAGDFTSYDGTARNRIARLNADGALDTSFDPGTGASGAVHSIALQPDGKVIVGGGFTTYGGTARNRIARLDANGALDASFNPGTGADSLVYSLAVLSDGKVLVGGAFANYAGAARNRIARLNADGGLDVGFDPGSGADEFVWSLAVQVDGKALIGGFFTRYDGTTRDYIARIDAGGRLDTSFNPPPGANDWVYALAARPDGKLLIGGAFTSYNGTTSNRIARLDGVGGLDASFDPGAGASSSVWSLALQPDGKVLIGGGFSTCNGVARSRIARLDAGGGLDASFNPGTGANGTIYALALQPDGKVLIGGAFANYDGTSRNRIARLHADGGLDASFNPGTGANSLVYALAVQPDGKVLIGGAFTSCNGTPRNRIARLNADGSLDANFNPGAGANGEVWALAPQADGKVLIAGAFTTCNGTPRNRVARLASDGALDASFNSGTGASSTVYALALQPDGKVLIGGAFISHDGIARNGIARLDGLGGVDASFDPGSGAGGSVRSLALQPDGKLLVGGDFRTYDGAPRNRLARIHAYEPYATYCDGPTLSCPCGNAGAAGNGCANSLNSAGARLAASGVASLANDTLALAASGMPNSSALYFQGTTRAAAAFGDGVRCAAGTIVRIAARTNVAGASSYPAPGQQPVSVRGAVATSGVRHYQVWYRNAALFCTPSTFNLTNGTSVNWAP